MASQMPGSDDEAVQATNDDATQSKKYAVERGYWIDNYIKYFCRGSVDKRTPEICRGYYARVKSIQLLLTRFLELTSRDCQVINLGAGYDSTYWMLCELNIRPKVLVDVDFPDVTSKKCYLIKSKKELLDVIQSDSTCSIDKDELHSKSYHIISCDLRKAQQLSEKLLTTNIIDTNLPTIFIAECVLVYMEPHSSVDLIKWIGTTFHTSLFLNYEPIRPHDRFGQTMVSNLKYRGCALIGIDASPDLDSQKSRFTENGWSQSWALDMSQVYSMLPQRDVTRIEKIDFLDERELLIQLLQHYTLSCGYNDVNSIGLERVHLENI